MDVPSNRDFAAEVRSDRLATLWKITLAASITALWGLFTVNIVKGQTVSIGLLVFVASGAGCLLTREWLRRGRFVRAVWAYAGGLLLAGAMALVVPELVIIQIVPFIFPVFVFVIGLLLPMSGTLLITFCAALLTILIPVGAFDNWAVLSLHQVAAVLLMFAAALLSGQVTGELHQVTEWALLNYQRERRISSELFENRALLERSLRRSEALSERLTEANAQLLQARAAAEEAKHFRGQFLANMSHELRTPLNAIIGFSETMLQYPEMYDNVKLPPAYQDDLNQIYNSGRQLLTLINDILDLSKVDAGKLDVKMGEVELGPVISSVMATASGLIGDRPIRLELEAPDPLPRAWADDARVRQVLLNLYSNAAKFTDEGSITLSVREAEEGVLLSLTDTGSGIAEEHLELIFEEFKQSQTEGRDPRSGAGLGLAISRQLLTLMGGRIWAESTPGKGSTFHVLLQPCPAVPEEALGETVLQSKVSL